MRHAAGSTRTAPRRRSTRALLVALLSASLLTTGSSSLATGDVDVEPAVAATESVVVEPTAEPTTPVTPAPDTGEDAVTGGPAPVEVTEAPTAAEVTETPTASEQPAEPEAGSGTEVEVQSGAQDAGGSTGRSSTAAAAAQATPMASIASVGVPPQNPSTNQAKLIVRAGGDRTNTGTSATTTTPLAGATFDFYRSGLFGSTYEASCTTDASGECGVIASVGLFGSSFFAVQTGVPSGWLAAESWGSSSNSVRYETGSISRGGTPNSRTVTLPASNRSWPSVRQNPTAPLVCGVNMAMVVDLSNSVTRPDNGTPAPLPKYKAAAAGFVDALSGTPSQIAVHTFASHAPARGTDNSRLPLTSVATTSGADTVKRKIEDLSPTPDDAHGGTNWDRGFHTVAETQEDYDVVLFLTDGDPTFNRGADSSAGGGSGSTTTIREVEEAIHSANAVKAQGARVITVGIRAGSGNFPAAGAQRLSLVSGPEAESDYFTTNFDELAETLRDIATANCEGTLTVVKEVVQPNGDVVSGGAGWTFSTPTSAVTPSEATTNATGATNFKVAYPAGTFQRNVTVDEPQRPGYSLVQQGGRNAVCRNTTTGAVTVTNVGATGFEVAVPANAVISCVVRNRVTVSDLSVTVTADPAFSRHYDWGITKSVRGERQQKVKPGEQATFTYDLVVTPSDPIDTNFVVSGVVSVTNPNSIAFQGVDVEGALPDGSCTVTGGTNVTVPVGGKVDLQYSCSLPTATATTTGQVSATATWDTASYGQTSGSATGSRAFSFAGATPATTGSPVTVVDDKFNLEKYEVDGTLIGNVVHAAAGTTTFTYEMAWTGEAGTCKPYTNNAWLSASEASGRTSQSAVIAGPVDATVTVCSGADLTVDRTVAPEHDRTYAWAIDKSADHSSIDVDADTGTATVSYAVDVTPGAATDSGWAMDGTIALTNPNDWQAVTATVSLASTLGGNASCTFPGTTDVDPATPGLQVTVPANTAEGDGSLEIDYSCTFATQPALTGTVTAHVVWDGVEHVTPHDRTTAAGALAESDWAVVAETNRTVEVFDNGAVPGAEVLLGTVTWDDGPKTFTYSLTHEGERGGCVDYTNRAWLSQTGQESEWDVEVCWPTPGIKVVKSAWNGGVELPQGVTLPVGTIVTWEYEVTNTGTSKLTDIELEDTYTTTGGATGKVEVDCPSTSLARGASMTCTGYGPVGTGVYGWAAPQP